jgi:hypothetical protein
MMALFVLVVVLVSMATYGAMAGVTYALARWWGVGYRKNGYGTEDNEAAFLAALFWPFGLGVVYGVYLVNRVVNGVRTHDKEPSRS